MNKTDKPLTNRSTINTLVSEIVDWLGCDRKYARSLLERAIDDDRIKDLLWPNLHFIEAEDVLVKVRPLIINNDSDESRRRTILKLLEDNSHNKTLCQRLIRLERDVWIKQNPDKWAEFVELTEQVDKKNETN